MKPPDAVYFQGGLTLGACEAGILMSVQKFWTKHPSHFHDFTGLQITPVREVFMKENQLCKRKKAWDPSRSLIVIK